ncbi:hypothetical protein [Streptomyces sp. NPDC002855]|uniref:hypothetical protein n=1 Tax=Streptomyces sp. NPDC002855 TaxID=3154437 RepID=UPI0033224E24
MAKHNEIHNGDAGNVIDAKSAEVISTGGGQVINNSVVVTGENSTSQVINGDNHGGLNMTFNRH